MEIPRNDSTWSTFGRIQRLIRSKLRERPRLGLAPTFPEFAAFLVRALPPTQVVTTFHSLF